MTARRRFDIFWSSGVIIVACLGLLTAWRIEQDYDATLASASLRLRSLARVADDTLSGNLRALDILIRDVAAQAVATRAADPEALATYMRSRAAGWPEVRSVSFIDAGGRIAATTIAALKGFDARRRPYFLLSTLPVNRGRLVLTGPTPTPLGSTVTFVARAVFDREGQLFGVVSLSLPERYFEDILASVRPDPGGEASLVTSDLVIVGRVPHEAAMAGRFLALTAAISDHLAGGGGASVHRTRQRAGNRLSAVRTLGLPFLHVVVSQATDTILGPWQRRAMVQAGAFLLVSAVTLVLVRLTRRSDRERQRLTERLRETLDLDHAVITGSDIGIAAFRADGTCILANPAFAAMVGSAGDEPGMMTRRAAILWEHAGLCQSAAAALKTGATQQIDIHHTAFRYDLWLDCRIARFRCCGEPHLLLLAADITARKRMQAEMHLAASVFHSTHDGIMVTGADGTILSVNQAFSEITGYSAKEAIGETPRILKSDHQEPGFYAAMWHSLETTGRWQGEFWNRRKSGEAFLVWETITAINDGEAGGKRYVAVLTDVTESRRKDAEIKRQAYHDALTGLPNRLLMHDRLGHAINLARRRDTRVAVMFFDLDHFKVVNDSLGHEVGDRLLVAVAERLQAAVRRTDTVARLGGDEFVVLAENFEHTADVARMVEAILTALNQPFLLAGQEIHTATSIGIAMFPPDGGDGQTLLKNADTAMYQAKAAGRGTFRFFDASMNARAIERLDLEGKLRHALANGEFELFYQPKVHLPTGRPTGVEALVRWRHPVLGLVPPDKFIPLAEETGLIVPLGDWILREACRQIRRWLDDGLPPVSVAVNVSARQFQDEGLAERIAAIQAETGLPAGSLEIELTESAVMKDPRLAIAQLERIRALDIGVAVDDFGTGYSSLAYLRRLPINTIKIDRSFIAGLGSNHQDAAIMQTVVGLGRTLGLEVVAEGVETVEQAALLEAAGCHTGQGYHYARPLPAAEVTAWLSQRGALAAAQ